MRKQPAQKKRRSEGPLLPATNLPLRQEGTGLPRAMPAYLVISSHHVALTT